jgi:glycosyltransferase involved in cell wall biosynthesis
MTLLLLHDKDHDLVARGPAQAGAGICRGRGGGLGIYLGHLVAGLRERGHRVVVVTFTREPGPAEEGLRDADAYRLRSFRFRFDRATASELETILDREKPDIVHLHSIPNLHPRLLRLLERAAPVLWSFHDVWPVCFRGTKLLPDGERCTAPLGYRCVAGACHRPGSVEGLAADIARVLTHPLYLRMYRRTTVATPSRYLRDLLLQNGFDAHKVRVVPLFSRFPGSAPGPAPESRSARVLYVGRLSSEKGLERLLEALTRLKSESWEAALVGDGPLHDRLPRHAEDAGLRDRVRFAGEADGAALEEHYRRASLVVVPSLVPESFGMVGVEAMAFGKPVVAFDAGGIAEWLIDGVNGFVVRHGDVAELADRIRRLIRDPALMARFGAEGRRRQQDEFTLQRHLDRIGVLYDELTANRAGGTG